MEITIKIIAYEFHNASYNLEKFTSSLENLNENIYDKPQVSKEISDLRSPYMFVENLYCETNKSTKEKIILLRRIITDMNIDIQVKVIK